MAANKLITCSTAPVSQPEFLRSCSKSCILYCDDLLCICFFNLQFKYMKFITSFRLYLSWVYYQPIWLIATQQLVCYTAVFSVVTQRWGEALRDDTKNGCVADYPVAQLVRALHRYRRRRSWFDLILASLNSFQVSFLQLYILRV